MEMDPRELVRRREKLFNEMKEGSVALLFAGHVKISSEDEDLPLYVNSNFFYLTNIEAENAILLLIKGVGTESTYLFVEPNDENKVKWTGKRLSVSDAKKLSQIDNVLTLNNFEPIFMMAIAEKNNEYGEIHTLYLDLSPELKVGEREHREPIFTTDVAEIIKSHHKHLEIEDIYEKVVELRMVKSPYEVALIKRAIEKTHDGILHALSMMKAGLYEWEVADDFEFAGRSMNRTKLAFPSIIASGENGYILHYPQQNDMIKDNVLVLFDLGYREGNYCADISRTYPVAGAFNELQRKIYQAVLDCNKAVIEYIHPGVTILELQDYTINFLANECLRLKLISEPDEIKKYYYHGIGHHLGIDTHDPSLGRDRPLVPGNIITVEPGLYFKELGIGVRIEDDVLVNEVGCEVLSPEIKKEVKDIEKLLASKH